MSRYSVGLYFIDNNFVFVYVLLGVSNFKNYNFWTSWPILKFFFFTLEEPICVRVQKKKCKHISFLLNSGPKKYTDWYYTFIRKFRKFGTCMFFFVFDTRFFLNRRLNHDYRRSTKSFFYENAATGKNMTKMS